MARFEVVLQMPGRQGRPTVYGGIVVAPGPADPTAAAAIVAESDRRDARPPAEVRAEVHDRAGGNDPAPTDDAVTEADGT